MTVVDGLTSFFCCCEEFCGPGRMEIHWPVYFCRNVFFSTNFVGFVFQVSDDTIFYSWGWLDW